MNWFKRIFIFIFISVVLIGSSEYSFTFCVFKLNQPFIAANLCEKKNEKHNCCHGSCMLKKQLQNQSGDANGNVPALAKIKIENWESVSAENNLLIPIVQEKNYSVLANNYQHNFIAENFHPPA